MVDFSCRQLEIVKNPENIFPYLLDHGAEAVSPEVNQPLVAVYRPCVHEVPDMMIDPRAGDGEILGDNIHGQARFMGLVVEQGEEDTGSDPLHVPPLADTEAVTEPLEIFILIPE